MGRPSRLEIHEVVNTICNGMPVDELQTLINVAASEPYLRAYIQLTHGCLEDDYPEVEIVGIRLETDAEYEKRVALENAQREKKKAKQASLNSKRTAKDRALYEKLKKQFDPS